MEVASGVLLVVDVLKNVYSVAAFVKELCDTHKDNVKNAALLSNRVSAMQEILYKFQENLVVCAVPRSLQNLLDQLTRCSVQMKKYDSRNWLSKLVAIKSYNAKLAAFHRDLGHSINDFTLFVSLETSSNVKELVKDTPARSSEPETVTEEPVGNLEVIGVENNETNCIEDNKIQEEEISRIEELKQESIPLFESELRTTKIPNQKGNAPLMDIPCSFSMENLELTNVHVGKLRTTASSNFLVFTASNVSASISDFPWSISSRFGDISGIGNAELKNCFFEFTFEIDASGNLPSVSVVGVIVDSRIC